MERLTIRNSDGTVSQPTSTRVCDVFHRLAEYEDSGFTPKEFAELAERMDDINKRFASLVDAGYLGKLQILPCAIGDHVFRVDTFPNGVKEPPAYPEYIVHEVIIGLNTEMTIYAHRIVNGGIVATSYEVFEEKDFGTVLFPSLEDAREACEDANKGES